MNKHKEDNYSSDKHSEHSEDEKATDKKKEKIEKPLKLKLPKGKHSFTVIGKLFC